MAARWCNRGDDADPPSDWDPAWKPAQLEDMTHFEATDESTGRTIATGRVRWRWSGLPDANPFPRFHLFRHRRTR